MSKRIEANLHPVNPRVLAYARTISENKTATQNERQLALMLEDVVLVLNNLLCHLHYGRVSISDEPPPPRQFAPMTHDDE